MNKWRLLSFLVIATFTVLAYYPSFWHAPRSDQIIYFFVTSSRHDWASLALSCFDLNRWGTYAPGDERLFRPLVYFFLGTEKYFFDYNFWLWQAAGVFLHLTVIWFLLKLLWQIAPGRVAFACTLFFAMLLMNMEMVIWTHVNSYLVFVIAMLIVLDHVYQNKSMVVIAVCFLISGFIYETANVFAVITAIFLMKKKHAWFILVPPLLYFILDVMDLRAHHIVLDMKVPGLMQGCKEAIAAWGFWIYNSLWPGFVRLYFDARNKISDGSFNGWFIYFGAAAAIILTMLGCRQSGPAKRSFIFLIITMMFFYALVIVIGRGHDISATLAQNIHYFYPFWALMMVLSGIFIGAVKNQKFQAALAGVLVVLSIVNGIKLYQINDVQAKGSRAELLLAASVKQLIEEKKNEKDFSFYVSPGYPGNYVYDDGQGHRSSFIGMLFPQYYKENMPKYIFDLT